MGKDGLIRLPDQMCAAMLRVLLHIRHTPEARLRLVRPERARAPVWSIPNADYDVTYRGEKVGRIWRFVYRREPHEAFPWHWDIQSENRKHEFGHALTLHEAMEQFRATWDSLAPDQCVA
jgi:hypothetical protein